MTSKSFVVCRLLGGSGRLLFVAAAPVKVAALLCPQVAGCNAPTATPVVA